MQAELRSAPETTQTETLHAIWDWVTAPERAPFLRLFFEGYVDAMNHPDRYPEGAKPMVRDWLDFVGSAWGPEGLDATTATLLIAVVRGLLLDRLAAADQHRTDQALARFAALLER